MGKTRKERERDKDENEEKGQEHGVIVSLCSKIKAKQQLSNDNSPKCLKNTASKTSRTKNNFKWNQWEGH